MMLDTLDLAHGAAACFGLIIAVAVLYGVVRLCFWIRDAWRAGR